MQPRPYTPADKAAVMHLLALNTPQYFHPQEEQDLSLYLDERREDYYVLELHGEVVAAGGINYDWALDEAKLSWDLVHPRHQGKGLGGILTQYRIALIRAMPMIRHITVRTSQHVVGFYVRQGFRELERVQDYWAPGFDMVRMVHVG